jgi:predicted enzyme related to lactoylglutathione lyase
MAPLHRLVLYARDVEQTVQFYQRHFGFVARRDDGDRIIELFDPEGGAILMVHAAGKGQKTGQVLIKLVFDVADVPGFCAACEKAGLRFGPIHQADGYVFANAKDPSGNAISVSSRAFR